MTITVDLAIRLLFAHWLADFVGQTDWMAKNKSKSNRALLTHIGVYNIILTIIMMKYNPLIAIANSVTHFMIDYFTSRASSKLWLKGDVHNFFVVIGFDQFLHITILLLTYSYLS